MGLARSPEDKDLGRFKFTAYPVNEVQVKRIHGGIFHMEHAIVIMNGGSGTGNKEFATESVLLVRLRRF